jgi:hypothetical protein
MQAGEQVGQAHQATQQGLQTLQKQLSPIQQKQFPLTKQANGKGGFNPDFSGVQKLITEAKQTNPSVGASLEKNFKQFAKNWEGSDKSYNQLLKNKDLFGDVTKWGKGLAVGGVGALGAGLYGSKKAKDYYLIKSAKSDKK